MPTSRPFFQPTLAEFQEQKRQLVGFQSRAQSWERLCHQERDNRRAAEQRTRELSFDVKAANARIESYRESLAKSAQQCNELQEKMGKLKVELGEVSGECTRLKEENKKHNELQEKMGKLKVELSEVRRECTRLKEENKKHNELQGKMGKLKVELSEVRGECTRLKEENKKHKSTAEEAPTDNKAATARQEANASKENKASPVSSKASQKGIASRKPEASQKTNASKENNASQESSNTSQKGNGSRKSDTSKKNTTPQKNSTSQMSNISSASRGSQIPEPRTSSHSSRKHVPATIGQARFTQEVGKVSHGSQPERDHVVEDVTDNVESPVDRAGDRAHSIGSQKSRPGRDHAVEVENVTYDEQSPGNSVGDPSSSIVSMPLRSNPASPIPLQHRPLFPDRDQRAQAAHDNEQQQIPINNEPEQRNQLLSPNVPDQAPSNVKAGPNVTNDEQPYTRINNGQEHAHSNDEERQHAYLTSEQAQAPSNNEQVPSSSEDGPNISDAREKTPIHKHQDQAPNGDQPEQASSRDGHNIDNERKQTLITSDRSRTSLDNEQAQAPNDDQVEQSRINNEQRQDDVANGKRGPAPSDGAREEVPVNDIQEHPPGYNAQEVPIDDEQEAPINDKPRHIHINVKQQQALRNDEQQNSFIIDEQRQTLINKKQAQHPHNDEHQETRTNDKRRQALGSDKAQQTRTNDAQQEISASDEQQQALVNAGQTQARYDEQQQAPIDDEEARAPFGNEQREPSPVLVRSLKHLEREVNRYLEWISYLLESRAKCEKNLGKIIEDIPKMLGDLSSLREESSTLLYEARKLNESYRSPRVDIRAPINCLKKGTYPDLLSVKSQDCFDEVKHGAEDLKYMIRSVEYEVKILSFLSDHLEEQGDILRGHERNLRFLSFFTGTDYDASRAEKTRVADEIHQSLNAIHRKYTGTEERLRMTERRVQANYRVACEMGDSQVLAHYLDAIDKSPSTGNTPEPSISGREDSATTEEVLLSDISSNRQLGSLQTANRRPFIKFSYWLTKASITKASVTKAPRRDMGDNNPNNFQDTGFTQQQGLALQGLLSTNSNNNSGAAIANATKYQSMKPDDI
ncbi:MAG: hypothetical protein Q9188_006732 [Gyalolechia gomerana]